MHEPQPVRSLRPEIPPAVEALLRRMTAKDREQRLQTPGEVAEELAALSGPGGGRPVPVSAEADLPPGPLGPDVTGPDYDRTDRLQDTSLPLPGSASLGPLTDLDFRRKFWEWTAFVELTLRRRGYGKPIDREAFVTLQRQLVRGCRDQAVAADGERRVFFERLGDLLKPWLSPEALAHTDLEIHYQLVDLFRHVGQELAKWIPPAVDDPGPSGKPGESKGAGKWEPGPPSGADSPTTIGRLLTLFKRRQP